MFTWLKDKWTKHGTKVLGGLTVAVGAINAASVEIGTILTDRERHFFTIVMTILGYMTVRRGFKNGDQK